MNEIVQFIAAVLGVFGGAAGLLLFLYWLVNKLVTQLLAKELDKYSETLRNETETGLRRLQSLLTKEELEHEVKVRRVDDKVADCIVIVYQKIFDLYEGVNSYLRIVERENEPSKDEKLEVVIKTNKDFWDYFLHNRPYVPPSLYKQVHQLAIALANIADEFTKVRAAEKKGTRLPPREGYWEAADAKLQQSATPMFTAMVAAVQNRLGVVDIGEHKE